MAFQYILVVTGQVEAPTDEHAKLQALMGVSLTGRLLTSPHEIAVEIRELRATDPQPTDDKKPVVMEH